MPHMSTPKEVFYMQTCRIRYVLRSVFRKSHLGLNPFSEWQHAYSSIFFLRNLFQSTRSYIKGILNYRPAILCLVNSWNVSVFMKFLSLWYIKGAAWLVVHTNVSTFQRWNFCNVIPASLRPVEHVLTMIVDTITIKKLFIHLFLQCHHSSN